MCEMGKRSGGIFLGKEGVRQGCVNTSYFFIFYRGLRQVNERAERRLKGNVLKRFVDVERMGEDRIVDSIQGRCGGQ